MTRRVVVTGLGVASPLGIGKDTFWEALLRGDSGIRPITSFDALGFPCGLAGQVPAYRIADHVPKSYRKATKLMARDIELAVVAACSAFEDAELASRSTTESPAFDPSRFGCNIGAGLISVDLDELTAAMEAADRDGVLDLRIWGECAMNGLTPLWLLKYLPNMLACHVTIIHGLEGPSNTIACGEASGHLAIGEAFRTIQRGQADLMICGGAETKVSPMGMMRQTLLGRLVNSDQKYGCDVVRPFQADACGTVNAEGGGLLILEEYSHAMSRNARIYAEIIGFGAGQDAPMSGSGGMRLMGYIGAIRRAMADAGVGADDIGCLIPSASGVKKEDAAELEAVGTVFGDRLLNLPTALLKRQLGSLAAGGSIEVVAGVMGIHARKLPPPLSAAATESSWRTSNEDHQTAICTARSTGGQSAAIVIRGGP